MGGGEEEGVADESEGCVDAGGSGEDFGEALNARVSFGGEEVTKEVGGGEGIFC